MSVLTTEPFPDFINGSAEPAPPYVSTDFIPLVRGNTTYKLPADALAPPVGADPTAVVGKTAVNGTAATYLRSDGAPPLADYVALLDTADQTLSGGANVTSHDLGTITTGTVTVDCGQCPLQFFINGGAFTMAAPVADGSTIILMINNGSAGAITFTGFDGGTHGDAIDTTNADKFSIFVWRVNGSSNYNVKAHQ